VNLYRVAFTNRVGNEVDLGPSFKGFPTREAAADRLAELKKVDNPSFRAGTFSVKGPEDDE